MEEEILGLLVAVYDRTVERIWCRGAEMGLLVENIAGLEWENCMKRNNMVS